MSAQEQSIKESGLALRKIKIVLCLVARELRGRNRNQCRRHTRKRSLLEKFAPSSGTRVFQRSERHSRADRTSIHSPDSPSTLRQGGAGGGKLYIPKSLPLGSPILSFPPHSLCRPLPPSFPRPTSSA